MLALVTGGAGFIGSTLVDRLLGDGHHVDAVDNLASGSLDNLKPALSNAAAFHFEQLDIRDPAFAEFVTTRKPEVIFHLAAQASVPASVEDPMHDAAVNIVGSIGVLEAARRANVRKIVYAASGGTLYGEVESSRLPVEESAPRAPLSPYGISKATVLDYLTEYRHLYGLDFTALALANVYGPRQDPYGEAGVVAIFAANLAAGRQSTINGDGEQTRDFVYVGDVVDAFARAASAASGFILNIGTGQQTSVNEIYRRLAERAGVSQPPLHGPARHGEVRNSALDATAAMAHLSWQPQADLSEGLRETFEAARTAVTSSA